MPLAVGGSTGRVFAAGMTPCHPCPSIRLGRQRSEWFRRRTRERKHLGPWRPLTDRWQGTRRAKLCRVLVAGSRESMIICHLGRSSGCRLSGSYTCRYLRRVGRTPGPSDCVNAALRDTRIIVSESGDTRRARAQVLQGRRRWMTGGAEGNRLSSSARTALFAIGMKRLTSSSATSYRAVREEEIRRQDSPPRFRSQRTSGLYMP